MVSAQNHSSHRGHIVITAAEREINKHYMDLFCLSCTQNVMLVHFFLYMTSMPWPWLPDKSLFSFGNCKNVFLNILQALRGQGTNTPLSFHVHLWQTSFRISSRAEKATTHPGGKQGHGKKDNRFLEETRFWHMTCNTDPLWQ